MANTYVMRESWTSRYFIYLRIKRGPLTRTGRSSGLPEIRRNSFSEGSPTFISRGGRNIVYLSAGNCTEKAPRRALDDFRIRPRRIRMPFYVSCAFIRSKECDMRANRRLRTKRARAANILFDRNFLYCIKLLFIH